MNQQLEVRDSHVDIAFCFLYVAVVSNASTCLFMAITTVTIALHPASLQALRLLQT